jgi:hypothetical protein
MGLFYFILSTLNFGLYQDKNDKILHEEIRAQRGKTDT